MLPWLMPLELGGAGEDEELYAGAEYDGAADEDGAAEETGAADEEAGALWVE